MLDVILALGVFVGLPLLAATIRAVGQIIVVQAGAQRALQEQGLDGRTLQGGSDGFSGYETVQR